MPGTLNPTRHRRAARLRLCKIQKAAFGPLAVRGVLNFMAGHLRIFKSPKSKIFLLATDYWLLATVSPTVYFPCPAKISSRTKAHPRASAPGARPVISNPLPVR